MAHRTPDAVMTGPERIALRDELVSVHGFQTGAAAAIVNSSNRADMLNKVIARCKTFPKAP